jgi:hypothetical protein
LRGAENDVPVTQRPKNSGDNPAPDKTRSKYESTDQKTFPSFDEFEIAINQELNRIHEILRPNFLFRAYELAKEKRRLENWREVEGKRARDVRASIRRHRRIVTQLQHAIKAIDVAQEIAAEEDPELLKNLNVIASQKELAYAEADLEWVIKEMFPGFIHPGLRKKGEEPHQFKLPRDDEPFPGFGAAKIDHWFIEELDKLLNNALTLKVTIAPVARDRIIKKVFEVALNETHDIRQIKNARIRMARKRKINVMVSKE